MPRYLAACSFGKDSLATVIVARLYNEPLDAVVYARLRFDDIHSAEIPEHENFINNVAIPKLKSWGIDTIIIDSPKTFVECFTRVRSRGQNEGKIVGFPIPGRCDIARDCKLPALKKSQKLFEGEDIVWYLGIAKDESNRLERLKEGQVSLLAKYGLAEIDAEALCMVFGLYSPVYEISDRGGCFFCPNAKDEELYTLRVRHPDIWRKLMALDRMTNRATRRDGRSLFNRKETFHELNDRLKRMKPYYERKRY